MHKGEVDKRDKKLGTCSRMKLLKRLLNVFTHNSLVLDSPSPQVKKLDHLTFRM
jgi:hypothetical protein